MEMTLSKNRNMLRPKKTLNTASPGTYRTGIRLSRRITHYKEKLKMKSIHQSSAPLLKPRPKDYN